MPEPSRFERSGGPPDLQAAFAHLITKRLGGRALDEQQNKEAAEGRFPDFACYRDLLLIEMKHLETDQQERLNEVLKKRIAPEDMPLFYGERDANLIMGSVTNREAIHAEMLSKLGRTLERILKSADKQFASYRSRHPRKNAVNICVLLNATLQEFLPEVVVRAIHGKMQMDEKGEYRFPQIDGILYISEKHFQVLPDGRPALGMVLYETHAMVQAPWKIPLLDGLAAAWSDMRTGGAAVYQEGLSEFDTVEDVPDQMSRSDFWLLEYKRDPYLATLTLEMLRVFFNRTMGVLSQTFLIGSWDKPSKDEAAEAMRMFQHCVAETNRRGTDMRDLHRRFLTEDERRTVDKGFPTELIALIDKTGCKPPPTAP